MERIETKLRWTDEQFKRRIGTTKDIFQTMLCILQDAYDKDHALGGSPPKVSVGDRLLITLQYYREYRTMEHIGADFDCSKCTVFRAIRWVEQMLTADECFSLRGAKCLQDESPKTVAVNVTEHLIVCLKKNQEAHYSSKKKRHTLKSQITADAANSEIYCPGQEYCLEGNSKKSLSFGL